VFCLGGFVACSDEAQQTQRGTEKPSDNAKQPVSKSLQLTVYKTPTCGCCGEWVDHVLSSGFKADVVNQQSVAHIKDRFGIPANARSCHTAVSDHGYVFEGHVPAKFIRAFLADVPEGALGLVVPAMPLGSPGMEYKDQFNPYEVLLMKEGGELEVFAAVTSYQSQF
jgi:hypothetical protein